MRGIALLVAFMLLPVASLAQEQNPPAPAPPAPAADAAIDATKLGVSLSRIQRGLRVAEVKEQMTREGLRMEFNVQVYGQAPKIDVLSGVDILNGHVPDTAPTHRQVIDFLTPPIYRSPTMPISTLAFWAIGELVKKSKKSQCEEEIANYRAMVMQGVNVSAPRCSQ